MARQHADRQGPPLQDGSLTKSHACSFLRIFLTTLFLSLLLFSSLVAPWPVRNPVFALTPGNPNAPITPASWLHPTSPGKPLDAAHPSGKQPPHAPPILTAYPWRVSMAPLKISVTPQAQDVFSNDKQLDISIAAGTVSPSQVSQAGGTLFLTITQLLPSSGGTRSTSIFFGTFQLQWTDAAGALLSNLSLAHPLTIRYHLRSDQISLFFGKPQVYAIWRPGDASTLLVGVNPPAHNKQLPPALKHKTGLQQNLADATPTPTAQQPPAPPAQQLQYATGDPSELTWTISTTLSGSSSPIVFSSSNITFGTQTPQALWGTPQDFQVGLNSGGLTYNYPLQLPPGPGGFVPPLNLTYSSGAVNESHNLQAAAPWVGEGWNLSLGSITWSQEDVTPGNGDRMESVWNISDPSGISGQLIPPDLNFSTIPPYDPLPQNLGTGTIWHSAPESHAKIQEIAGQGGGYPCWRVYLPNGVMEEFGCLDSDYNVYSDQSYKIGSDWVRYRWDLDLMVDPYGNQIHFHYQRITQPSWIQDAVLSDVEYDDPTCHQFAYCSTWNPQVKLIFDASTLVTNLTNPSGGGTCGNYTGTTQRCDDPIDLSGSGGLPAPHVMNSYVLNDIQVLAQGNLLHKYVFSYEQSESYGNGNLSSYTDPLSGQTESVAGFLDLARIDELGTGGNAPPSAYPEVNITYDWETEHYIDTYQYTHPYGNCQSWVPLDPNDSGTCLLWSASINARYITKLDNGRGWHENITWIEARNNTRGVDSGSANDAFACTGHYSQNTDCIEADDHAWSREVVRQRDAISNGVTSTWQYHYYLTTGLAANAPGWPDCSNSPCSQGATWGDQNDDDYADYYNSQFMSYYQTKYFTPDGGYHIDTFGSTNGWGIAKSGIFCQPPPGKTCQLAPYWGSTTETAGKLKEQDDWDNSGKVLQRQQTWTYDLTTCPPPGVSHSLNGGPPDDPGDTELVSTLDRNNPVVVCDPRVTQQDTFQIDGTTTNHNDPQVVHKTITYVYDGGNAGSSRQLGYDYGNLSDVDQSGDDLANQHFHTFQIVYPDDNVNGNNFIYITDLPAVNELTDQGKQNVYQCSQNFYGGSNGLAPPTLPDVTETQQFINAGNCTGSTINVEHTYDTQGQVLTATDGDNHLGCNNNQYSACATYDSSTYDTHMLTATNALGQVTTYAYDSSMAGGYGQWLTSTKDANGQTTYYQYDVMGRLTGITRPGDSQSSPTVTYSYINNCSNGSTSPCLELDTTTTFTSGGPGSTMRQWYDGWGHLVETQTPSPDPSKTIVTYTLYDAMGDPTTKSLPYAVNARTTYITPDQAQARTVTGYDYLQRPLGSATYKDSSNIVLQTSISYTVAVGVSGFSGESQPFEEITTMDGAGSYNHQSIQYNDALGRERYAQVYTGEGPYTLLRTVQDNYDIAGNVTSVVTFDSGSNQLASYSATFDAVNRLTGYNDSDLGSCSNNPSPPGCQNGSAWNFTYDADNNQLSQIDPRNQATYTSYDNLDRPLCRATQSAPCSHSPYASYFYDSYTNNSNPGVTFPAGCTAPGSPYTSYPVGRTTAEVFSSSAGNGWRCSGYDARGELDQSTLSVTADGHTSTNTMNMSYNDGGELTSLVYPDQETLTSQYDSDGHLLSAYFGTPSSPDPVNFLVGQVSYTSNGLLSGLALGGSGPKGSPPSNSVFSTSYGYDGIQRPQSSSVTEGGTTLWSQSRTYDNVGNVLQLSTVVPTLSGGSLTDNQSFCYDALDRLVWAGNTGSPSGGDHCGNTPTGSTTPTYQQPFSYDNLDRMTSGPSGTMSYDSTHVHAADSASSFPNQYASYDAMGNMTCRNVDTGSGHTCGSGQTGATMTYDNEGRLSSWTAPSGTTATDSFLYDNEGNRVLQRTNDSNGITDTITFDSYLEIVLHNRTTSTTKYYSVGGQRVAMRSSGTLTNPLYYLVNDMQGGTSLVLTSGGGVQAVQLYAPYGAVRYSQGTVPTTYNYTGQRLDSETGLLYYGFRYYDPVVGQFVRADTTDTNAKGMDGYAYVGDNPETKNDPTGHDGWNWGLIVAVVAVVVVVAVVAVVAAPVVLAAAAGAAEVATTAAAADGAAVAGAAAVDATTSAVADATAAGVADATGAGVADATATTADAAATGTVDASGTGAVDASTTGTADTAGDTSASTSSTNSWSTRAQQLRTLNQVGKTRNISLMDYNIEGESDSVWASSGPDFNGSIPKPTEPYFDATATGNNPRNADSEYKLLNWLAQRFNPAGVPRSDISGTVDLYTERPPCTSCSNVINLFRVMFPLIELNVFDGP